MDYDALEVELAGVLNGYFGANLLSSGPDVLLNTVFSARQMPENQVDLLQDYATSVVNVQYADSVYSEARSTAQVMQDEQIKVVCYLQCNLMKGTGGGYKLVDCVKRALLGYQPVNARTRMYISNYGDWRIEDGQLNPYVEFSFWTVAQQVINDSDVPYGTFVAETGDVYGNGAGPLISS